MKIRHYYHCYAAGAWQQPVEEHFTALAAAGLTDTVTTVGLVGNEVTRQAAGVRIIQLSRELGLPQPARWIEADQGWEQVTLQAVHDDVRAIPGDYAVLYMHTKGAHDPSNCNHEWRRTMTRRLVGDWKFCAGVLEAGYDATGCHWVTQYGHWFFAGNFWWCSAEFLRKLPALENESRYSVEYWISQGADVGYKGSVPAPKVFSVIDGFPGY